MGIYYIDLSYLIFDVEESQEVYFFIDDLRMIHFSVYIIQYIGLETFI